MAGSLRKRGIEVDRRLITLVKKGMEMTVSPNMSPLLLHAEQVVTLWHVDCSLQYGVIT